MLVCYTSIYGSRRGEVQVTRAARAQASRTTRAPRVLAYCFIGHFFPCLPARLWLSIIPRILSAPHPSAPTTCSPSPPAPIPGTRLLRLQGHTGHQSKDWEQRHSGNGSAAVSASRR